MGEKEDVELDIEDLKALEGLDREAKEWERDVEVDRTRPFPVSSTFEG